MKRLHAILFAAAAGFAVNGAALAAKPDDKGPPAHAMQGKHDDHKSRHDDKGHDDRREQALRYAGISAGDARKWKKQYRVGGYKPLPPGIRKNLARGKPIPPGIAMTRLPDSYVRHLPRYEGYEWRGYGTDLVLVHLLSNKIADVILDALD